MMRGPGLTRRTVLRGGVGLAAGAVMGPGLASCGVATMRAQQDYPIGTPDKPVTLPIFDDNPAVDSGLQPEQADVLKVLNYAEYIAPEVKQSFKEKYGAEIQVTAYSEFQELQRRLLAPGAEYDVVYAGPTIMSRLVHGKLIQPFNRDYLSNMSNLWSQFQDPWYDQGAQYSVPYCVYSTGISYRKDRVGEVPENGYMLLWDPEYQGNIGVFDDSESALVMAMLAWGISADINTTNPDHIEAAKDQLTKLLALGVTVDNLQAEGIPSGRFTVHQAWSGDLTFAADYVTGDTTIADVGYWVPTDRSERIIGNETISISTASRSPVLAHAFIDDLLDPAVAETNMSWIGYQQPIQSLSGQYLVDQNIFPRELPSTIVEPEDFAVGLQYIEKSVQTEAVWLRAWQEFLSGTS